MGKLSVCLIVALLVPGCKVSPKSGPPSAARPADKVTRVQRAAAGRRSVASVRRMRQDHGHEE